MTMSAWENVLARPVEPGRDHIRGPIDAPVTLVEYGDYECPYCGAAHPVVEALREAMGPALRFVYRHFPLMTIHPHAWMAAEAAEAAGVRGEFWAMHDLLFEDQRHLEPADLLARARVIGLDPDAFEEELRRHVHAPRVQEDFMSGVHSGVNGTPSFFINGARYTGPVDAGSLLSAVELAGLPG